MINTPFKKKKKKKLKETLKMYLLFIKKIEVY
jgi:hypothetical protein